MRTRLAIAIVFLVTTAAQAEWRYEPYTGPWLGNVTCTVINRAATPRTLWVEWVEQDNDGTVEPAPPCVNVSPGGRCDVTSTDARARRCRVAWSGVAEDVLVSISISHAARAAKLEARRALILQRSGKSRCVESTRHGCQFWRMEKTP